MNEALSRYLRPGGCFYDVGAHIGFYSLLAARLVGQTGAVIAFEPDTDNAEILRQNAARNGLQICVVSAAVSNQDGTIRFQRSTGDGPSRMSGMVIRDNLPAAKESEIVCCPAVSLDGFSSSHRPPTLVKIDVEGAEIQVLEGARSLLETKKPVLIIEVHHQKDLPAVHSILSGLGYALEPLRLEAAKIGARNYLAFVAGLMKSASECG